MKADRKIEAEKIHIVNIRTLKGNIECSADTDVNKVVGHLFGFDLKTALNVNGCMMGLKLQTDIKAVDKKGEELPITGSYTHEMIFKIENLSDFIEEANGENKIDASLGSTLASIIYSTVRGLIYGRSQGTSLGVVVLPVIAPLKLMGIQDQIERQNDRDLARNEMKKGVKKNQKTDKTRGNTEGLNKKQKKS